MDSRASVWPMIKGTSPMIWSNPLKTLNLGQVGQVFRFYRYSAHTHAPTSAYARIAVHMADLSHLSQTLAVARVPAVPVVPVRVLARRLPRGDAEPRLISPQHDNENRESHATTTLLLQNTLHSSRSRVDVGLQPDMEETHATSDHRNRLRHSQDDRS